ncbi:DMT family transporter [Desulfospira joergensenii]|uniref:DMT family transporter n=1 Tax=Desulfospira joergensenii TaxID=53329 RepID=UPI0003B73E07|nr:DMT family transporter [Desulfospira joergensenii]
MKQDKVYVDIKGVILLVILCVSWGLNQVAIKICIAVIPPVLQAGIRSTCSAFIVLLWMFFRGKSVFEKDGTIWWGILAGFFFSVQFILLFWGLEFTNASRAVILLNTAPFVVALGAQLFLKTESLTRIQILGLIMAFSGIIVAFHESLNLPTQEMLIGDIMLLGAAVAWGAGTVLIKASPLTNVSPSKVLLYQLLVSAPILLTTSVFLEEGGILVLNYVAIACLIYQIIWIAFITYVVWFWLIRKYPVSRIAPFTFLTPLFGVMAGAFLLGEPITSFLLCALVLVGTGIYFVNQK